MMKRIEIKWDIENVDIIKKVLKGKVVIYVGDSFVTMEEDSVIGEITATSFSVGVTGLPSSLSGKEVDILFKMARTYHHGYFKTDTDNVWIMADGRVT